MDTMKLLLGATIALLLGALVVSWQGMNTGVKNTSPDEIARLRAQVAELRQEQERIQLEKQIQLLKSTPAVAPTPTAGAAEIEALRVEFEASKMRLAEIEAEKAARDAKVAQDEEGLLGTIENEKADTELKRARMISQALLIGKVKEYVEDAQFGGFITFDVLMPEQVQAGVTLAIRRKTGILGLLKVSDVTAEGGIANPLPGFEAFQPQVGDELILPPQY